MEASITKIGVLSDTHGYFDPALPNVFVGAAMILHAGDAGSARVLDELNLIAPVYAVQGNVDPPALGLPLSFRRTIGRLQIEMVHILPAPQSQLETWSRSSCLNPRQAAQQQAFVKSFEPSTRVVIFGHSHESCLAELGAMAFFNPGSAGRKRFSLPRGCGLMEFEAGIVRLTILSLEGYNRGVVKGISLRLGE